LIKSDEICVLSSGCKTGHGVAADAQFGPDLSASLVETV
jgi:hypothetical protein